MADTVRVTWGQIRVSNDRAANLEVASSVIDQAARVGSQLVVLPEYASAFDPHGTTVADAESLDGPFISGLRDRARRTGTTVVAGVLLPSTDPQKAVNAVVVIDAVGEVAGVYRKVHLYDAFGHRESDRLVAGRPEAPSVVWQVGALTFGVITCYDLRFPESARRVVDAGAQVIVVPAAWATGPHKADQWRTLARARAIENTVVVLAVGQAGPGVTGCSLLVGPDGVVAVECDAEPQIRTADIDPAALEQARAVNPSLANRRYAVVPAAGSAQ